MKSPIPWIILGGEILKKIPQVYHSSKAKHDITFLPDHALKVFERFKTGYDGMDTSQIAACVAAKFKGDFYGAETKRQLVRVFDELFESLPFATRPYLTITLHRVRQDADTAYEAIISFNAKLALAGVFEIPFTDFEAGKVLCRIQPCGTRKAWQITKLEKF
jgi:hypothetical protein